MIIFLVDRYASRAKSIKNCAHINEDPKDAMLREFQKEIEQLKQQLDNGTLPCCSVHALTAILCCAPSQWQ